MGLVLKCVRHLNDVWHENKKKNVFKHVKPNFVHVKKIVLVIGEKCFGSVSVRKNILFSMPRAQKK